MSKLKLNTLFNNMFEIIIHCNSMMNIFIVNNCKCKIAVSHPPRCHKIIFVESTTDVGRRLVVIVASKIKSCLLGKTSISQ